MGGNYWNDVFWKRVSRRQLLQAGAAAGVGLGIAVACGGDSGKNGGSGTATAPDVSGGQPKSGGRLRELNTSEPDQYDPHRDAGYPGLIVMSAVYNGLLRTRLNIGEDFVIEGDLATGPPEQPDDTTYVFTLNDGITWQDVPPTNGRPLTAEDIKLNFERMVTDKPDYVLRPMFEMVDKVEASDDKTVTVKLKYPYGQFLANNADIWAKVIPREMYEGDQAKLKPVGSGPFIFKEARQGVGQTLEKNPNYFREGRPYIDGIDFTIIDRANPALSATAFQNGELDTHIGTQTQIMQQLRSDYGRANYAERFSVMNPLMINNSRAPFSDERVRQAIYYAIDPQLIIQLQFQGLAKAGQPLPLWLTRYLLPEEKLPKRDVQKAKQLLAAAGYENGFKFTNRTFQGGTQAFGTLQVQQSLKEAGIEMVNEEMEWANWRSNVYGIKGDFEVTIGGEFDYLSPDRQLYNAFYSKGSANNRHVNDPKLDDLLVAARQELDPDKAAERYQEAVQYLVDHAISVWLPQGQVIVATQPWVKGWFWQWSAGALFERNYMDDVWLDK